MVGTDSSKVPELLRLGSRIAVLPIVHGSGQFAMTVRRWMLEKAFDCVAVPLPESFRESVEAAVLDLPRPSIVMQFPWPRFDTAEEAGPWSTAPWSPDDPPDEDSDAWGDEMETVSYVPIDPCQGVIMSIRAAMGEHVPRAYIDLETDPFRPFSNVMPDPYAVRHVSPERFAAAVLPTIPRPPEQQTRSRLVYMAGRLADLERRHARVLFVCSVLHWPWIREAYNDYFAPQSRRDRNPAAAEILEQPEHDLVQAPQRFDVDPKTLMFLFGELPFITGLYERARRELEDDEDLPVDGVKELLLAGRDSYLREF
jgi:hypothetical protein